MPAAPAQPLKLSRPMTRIRVRLGQPGQAPAAGDEVDYLIPIRIERSAGGDRITSCVLQYDLAQTGQRILDTLTPKEVDRQIELVEVDVYGAVLRVLFWGKLAAQPLALSQGTEQVQFVARLDPHLFGEPLGRISFYDPVQTIPIDIDRPMTFNPEIDGAIRGNRSNASDPMLDTAWLFFDAAAVDTAAARAAHGQVSTTWKLYEAVHYVCWRLNTLQDWIDNPTLQDCRSALKAVDDGKELLQNVTIPYGTRLPQALDLLLQRFDCGWYVDFEQNDDGDTIRTIKFYRFNHGVARDVFLQRPGEFLDPAKSSLADAQLTFDIGTLANVVIGAGEHELFESTWELQKLWPVAHDSVDYDLLDTTKDYPVAGRKWGLNESGAWTGLRPEITAAHDLAGDIGRDDTLQTTRRFLPCLSRVSDPDTSQLESRGYWVRWYNPTGGESGTGGWEKVTWSFSILETECAIWFETVPQELWALVQDDPASARIQITATVQGDLRHTATATRQETSANANELILRLDLADKFHFRTVLSASIFDSERASADERYESAELQAFVNQVRDNTDAARLSCSLVLEGLDHAEYQIGDRVTKINGRNISLNRNNPASGTPKALQIVGINLLVAEQRTELLVDTFDEELS